MCSSQQLKAMDVVDGLGRLLRQLSGRVPESSKKSFGVLGEPLGSLFSGFSGFDFHMRMEPIADCHFRTAFRRESAFDPREKGDCFLYSRTPTHGFCSERAYCVIFSAEICELAIPGIVLRV